MPRQETETWALDVTERERCPAVPVTRALVRGVQMDGGMADTKLCVKHVFVHEPGELEKEVNEALRRIEEEEGVVGDIKYAIDPTGTHVRGGFGALLIYEVPIR
jgi:hypothetical protein